MNRLFHRSLVIASFVSLFIALVSGVTLAQSNASKTLQGKILSSEETPLSGAIVYLQDNKTNTIRSFISTNDGSYRFGQLATDTDYKVWAQYKNTKSSTRTISSYDSRKLVTIDLHIKTK